MAKNKVFLGLYGSGKTEIAMNFAIKNKLDGKLVAIADVDVTASYFRVREYKDMLEEKDIRVIAPPDYVMRADLPLIDAAVAGYLQNPDYLVVLDVGGDEKGSIVIGSLKEYLSDADVYFVINARRPFCDTVEKICHHIERIQRAASVEVDYLINNTNLGSQTTVDVIREGEEIVKEVSRVISIPVAFNVVAEPLDYEGEFETFKIRRYLIGKEELV
ncbi:cobalamin biosynthesis protein CobQ [Thermotoga sp. Ku-13t]|uniref:cobalamin biosynthesis protein CobQ n=1 Tax=Thermotoga sp. Ku-13t TaxID=1755813 RepID=UPI0013EB4FF3|nr:cobalamin biosynthesis protein CobQ [Thermotoga sp. Ku-13t]KAF2958947.1 cobalamin biosynthesis protein CobQ [Thermotoga sp. Ku-13t]